MKLPIIALVSILMTMGTTHSTAIESNTQENKIEVKQEKQENKVEKKSVLIINNKEYKLGKHYKDLYDPSVLKEAQDYINQGNIVVQFGDLINNDGTTSLLAGHNPGIFADLAKSLKEGDKGIVYDRNGNAKEYTFTKWKIIHENDRASYEDPEMIKALSDPKYLGDAIIIQYCEDPYIDLWVGK